MMSTSFPSVVQPRASYAGGGQVRYFDTIMQALADHFPQAASTYKPLVKAQGLVEAMRDYTPASFDAWRPDDIARTAAAAGADNPRTRLISTTPSNFHSLTSQPPSTQQVGALTDMLRARQSTPDAYGQQFYADAMPDFQGFGDIPFLQYKNYTDDPGFAAIAGHEGRHRMGALSNVYGPDTPLTIQAHAYGDSDLNSAVQQPFVLPQSLNGLYDSDGSGTLNGDKSLGLYLQNAPRAWRKGGVV